MLYQCTTRRKLTPRKLCIHMSKSIHRLNNMLYQCATHRKLTPCKLCIYMSKSIHRLNYMLYQCATHRKLTPCKLCIYMSQSIHRSNYMLYQCATRRNLTPSNSANIYLSPFIVQITCYISAPPAAILLHQTLQTYISVHSSFKLHVISVRHPPQSYSIKLCKHISQSIHRSNYMLCQCATRRNLTPSNSAYTFLIPFIVKIACYISAPPYANLLHANSAYICLSPFIVQITCYISAPHAAILLHSNSAYTCLSPFIV